MLKVKELFWTPLRVFWTYNMDKEIFLKVNIVTIFPEFFMDPLKQAHHSHRSKQISQQMREARMARDTAKIDKMQKLQMEL
mgnify:CR=1 FL=1